MAYQRLSTEEKEQRKKELMQKVENIIDNFQRSPADLIEYLKFNSKFYQYSKNNNTLIYQQNRYAQYCGSFKHFKDMGYSVKKGEHGIKILVPYISKYFYNADTEEWKKISEASVEQKQKIKNGEMEIKQYTSFGVGTVFDISQTDCPVEDYPNFFGFGHESKSHRELFNAVKYYAESKGIPVEIVDLKSITLSGQYNAIDNSIELSDKLNDDRLLSVMTHELSHALLHNSALLENNDKHIMQIEFEADALSLLLRERLGISDIEDARQAHLQASFKQYMEWAEANKSEQHCPTLSEILDNINETYSNMVEDFDNSISHYFELHPDTEKSVNNFSKTIDDFLNGKINPYAQIFVCKTTDAMLACGAKDLDVIINQSTLRKIMSDDTTKYRHPHNLDKKIIKAIPGELSNPIMILNGSEESSIVLISNLTDENNQNIIISCKLNSEKSIYEVNEITSVYPKNNITNYINNQLSNKKLIGCNKKRANRLLKSLGLQSSEVEASIDYTDIIPNSDKNVNSKSLNKNSIVLNDNNQEINDKTYFAKLKSEKEMMSQSHTPRMHFSNQKELEHFTRFNDTRYHFYNCTFDDIHFSENVVIGQLERCRFNRCTFENFDAESISFNNSVLTDCNIINCNLKSCNFENVGLYQSQISKSNFTNANFATANIKRTRFDENNLSAVKFHGATLNGVIITEPIINKPVEGLYAESITWDGATYEEIETLKKNIFSKLKLEPASLVQELGKAANSLEPLNEQTQEMDFQQLHLNKLQAIAEYEQKLNVSPEERIVEMNYSTAHWQPKDNISPEQAEAVYNHITDNQRIGFEIANEIRQSVGQFPLNADKYYSNIKYMAYVERFTFGDENSIDIKTINEALEEVPTEYVLSRMTEEQQNLFADYYEASIDFAGTAEVNLSAADQQLYEIISHSRENNLSVTNDNPTTDQLSIDNISFDNDNYMHFSVDADGYRIPGYFRVFDPANGTDMEIVSIDNWDRHPIISEQWDSLTQQCRSASLEKYRELTGQNYSFSNENLKPSNNVLNKSYMQTLLNEEALWKASESNTFSYRGENFILKKEHIDNRDVFSIYKDETAAPLYQYNNIETVLINFINDNQINKSIYSGEVSVYFDGDNVSITDKYNHRIKLQPADNYSYSNFEEYLNGVSKMYPEYRLFIENNTVKLISDYNNALQAVSDEAKSVRLTQLEADMYEGGGYGEDNANARAEAEITHLREDLNDMNQTELKNNKIRFKVLEADPITGYKYNVQVHFSHGFHENFVYSGMGRFCENLDEVKKYINKIKKEYSEYEYKFSYEGINENGEWIKSPKAQNDNLTFNDDSQMYSESDSDELNNLFKISVKLNEQNLQPIDVLQDKKLIDFYSFSCNINNSEAVKDLLWKIQKNDMQTVAIMPAENGYTLNCIEKNFSIYPFSNIVYETNEKALSEVFKNNQISKLVEPSVLESCSAYKDLSILSEADNLKYPFIQVLWSDTEQLKDSDCISLKAAQEKFDLANQAAENNQHNTSFSLHLSDSEIYNFKYNHSLQGQKILEYIKNHLQEAQSDQALNKSLTTLNSYINSQTTSQNQFNQQSIQTLDSFDTTEYQL